MALSPKYEPKGIEEHWYSRWMEEGLFHSEPDQREAYTIVIPPPNVTGQLHMGHMLNNTLQDILIRRARMLGKNACWVPGTDHASIATEAKVVNLLKEQGKTKFEVGREKFLEEAFNWKEKYGGIILQQLQQLGCSCDWERTRFTMEPKLSDAVIRIFNDLYSKGYIYRGARMVNWDPEGKTALSDEEVIYAEQEAELYYIKYLLEDGSGHISIATTRPETLLGDTAVCVNPNDQRYTGLIGKKCMVPLVNRPVRIIADDYVDAEFGTGALKVTPAHDINDYELGQRHHLASIDVFNEDGSMSEAAGLYIGEDRFVVRNKITEQLKAENLLEKIEKINNKIGRSERTHAIIEPRISTQWFVNMEKFLTDHPQVLKAVMDDEIKFYPPKFKNTYKHWLENIKDWCISRQLWWGHRIPAWYLPSGEFVIALNETEALTKAQQLNPEIKSEDLKQDEDVLDTWFSSWLWPMSVFDGFAEEGKKELAYYYPTSDLVTAPDIIFFWVARMIMAGYAFTGKKPFKRVYFTGIVRDKLRRKMSKSLGNSPEPLELMQQYGTDGVRMGLILSAPAGNDILFDEALCEQGRNFCNKLWNSYRLIQGWEIREETYGFYVQDSKLAHDWMTKRIATALESINNFFDEFRISDALMELYKLCRDDFSSWYLEMLKPAYGKPIPSADLEKIKSNFEILLQMLHPFMPFITEHLWQNMSERKDFINKCSWPIVENKPETIHPLVFELITEIRAKRNEYNIPQKIPGFISIKTTQRDIYEQCKSIIFKLSNVSAVNFGETPGLKSLVGTDEVFMQFENFEEKTDTDKLQKEILRLQGFLNGVEKKLHNENFMANAQSEVIAREKQKQADTLAKIEVLKAQLN